MCAAGLSSGKVRKYIAVLLAAAPKFRRKITIFYDLIDFTLGGLRGARLKGKTKEEKSKLRASWKVSTFFYANKLIKSLIEMCFECWKNRFLARGHGKVGKNFSESLSLIESHWSEVGSFVDFTSNRTFRTHVK